MNKTTRWFFKAVRQDRFGPCTGTSLNPGNVYQDNNIQITIENNGTIFFVNSIFAAFNTMYVGAVSASQKKKDKRTLTFLQSAEDQSDIGGDTDLTIGLTSISERMFGLDQLKSKRVKGKKTKAFFTGVRAGSAVFSLTEFLVGKQDCTTVFNITNFEPYKPKNPEHNPQ